MLRGLIRNGVKVASGSKLIEVDPIHDRVTCDNITTKMLAIGEGVLKAIMLKTGARKEEEVITGGYVEE